MIESIICRQTFVWQRKQLCHQLFSFCDGHYKIELLKHFRQLALMDYNKPCKENQAFFSLFLTFFLTVNLLWRKGKGYTISCFFGRISHA